MAEQDGMTWEELEVILENTPGAYEQVVLLLEDAGKIPNKLSDLLGLGDRKVAADEAPAAEMTEAEATAELKRRLNVLVAPLKDLQSKGEAALWWFPNITTDEEDKYNSKNLDGKTKRRMGSLASHLGLRNGEFQKMLQIAKATKYTSWKSKFGVPTQKYKHLNISWLALMESMNQSPGWAHVPKKQTDTKDYQKKPAWVGRPKEGYLEGTNEDQKRLNQMTRATTSMIDTLVKDMAVDDVLDKLQKKENKSRAGCKNSLVEYTIGYRTFQLPCNYTPVRTKKYEDMKEEQEELNVDNNSLLAENMRLKEEAEKNERYIEIGKAIVKVKDIIQRPTSLESDSFYTIAQAVAPGVKPHSLALMTPLLIAAFLANIGIGGSKNEVNNEILRAVPNATPSDQTFRNIIQRAQQHCFEEIATELDETDGPVALAFDKGEREGLGRLVKEITRFSHSRDQVVSIRLNSDAAKGKDKETAQSIDASLDEVDAYRINGKRTKLIGQCTDSGGGGTTEGVALEVKLVDRADDKAYYIAACMLHALSKSLQNALEEAYGKAGLGEDTFQQLLHTCWSLQEALGEEFEAEWNRHNPGTPAGRVLSVDGEDFELVGSLPPYLEGVEAADLNLKLQKPLITRWWHVNVCAMQVMAAYSYWLNLMNNIYETKPTQKIKTITENGIALGKSDLIEVDGLFFCAFCRSYWARHMSFLHLYDDKSGTFGHSARLILVRYMMMLSDLQKVKKMESRHWDKHKSSLNNLPTEDIDNGVFGKETALKQSADFFEKYESTLIDNAGRWVEPNLLPLAIGGTSPTSWVFAQWLAEEDPPAELGEDILKYYDETHKCEIDLRELRKLLDDLPEGTRDEVWENNTLSKHRELICEKIAFGMDIWAEDDAEALRYDIKSSMLLVKHHTQSTEAGVQEVARCSKGGRNERDASALSTLRSMHISPINQKIAQAYKEKKKLSGNQHQGPGVEGEREIRSGRAKVKEEEGSECRGRYDIPSKEKAKEIISVTLQSVPTEGSRKKVAAVMKKRKLGDDSAPCAKKVRTSQSQLRREEAEIAHYPILVLSLIGHRLIPYPLSHIMSRNFSHCPLILTIFPHGPEGTSLSANQKWWSLRNQDQFTASVVQQQQNQNSFCMQSFLANETPPCASPLINGSAPDRNKRTFLVPKTMFVPSNLSKSIKRKREH